MSKGGQAIHRMRRQEHVVDCVRTAECANTEAMNSRRCLNIHRIECILVGECDVMIENILVIALLIGS